MTGESSDFIYDTIDMFARNNNFIAIDNFLHMVSCKLDGIIC